MKKLLFLAFLVWMIIPVSYAQENNTQTEEVEFGRLNVVRAPQSVLDAALAEAINALTQPGVEFITTDASGRLIAIIGQEDWKVNYYLG